MTTIVTRAGKGSPLTHTEVDTNFTNLNTNKLEAGAIALGSAATPSISFTGDTNTGIYSPGADQVAVATNGTRRLLIDSAGALTLDTGDATIYGVRVGRGGGAISTNTAVGASALSSNTSGANNTAIGNNALRVNTTNVNTAVGDSALYSCTTGALNVAIGPFALYSNISGTTNIAIGRDALYFNTATGNIAIGTTALKSTTTGGGNIGIGDQVLFSNTTGTLNTVIGGRNTAYDNTTGSNNVVVGDLALRFNTTGSNNTCIGINAGYNLTTGSNNTIIGNVLGTAGLADTVIIGAGAAERLRIDSSGRLLVGTIASPAHQLQVSTDSAGKPSTNTWTIVSDERIKEEIELADLDLCYQAVKTIPLKRFKWKDEVYTEEQVRDRRKLGWIAQDVEAVFPKAVGTYEFKYNQVFEETIIPAVEEVLDDEGNVTTPARPERIEKGELISEDVIEDCRDLNSDQLYAAMYGAIQKLMVKVETLETELASLKAA